MNKPESTKINKREYWQGQIQKWQESNLSQAAFCNQAGIKLVTFIYWRGLLLDSKNKNINQFVPLKIVKNVTSNETDARIQIKLTTGHMVYLPIEIGINEIAKLIHSLGLPHA